MNDIIKQWERNGYTVKVYHDECGESPREWDNLGTMICFHRRYDLGDKHNLSIEEARELAKRKDIVSLPLYLYDHSGITMSADNSGWPFSCPWDAGQVGFIYIDYKKIREEYGVTEISESLIRKVTEILEGEVETYDKYLRGEVYGFIISRGDEDHLDSCWGFTDMDHLEECANEAVDSLEGHDMPLLAKTLKGDMNG